MTDKLLNEIIEQINSELTDDLDLYKINEVNSNIIEIAQKTSNIEETKLKEKLKEIQDEIGNNFAKMAFLHSAHTSDEVANVLFDSVIEYISAFFQEFPESCFDLFQEDIFNCLMAKSYIDEAEEFNYNGLQKYLDKYLK